MVKGKKSEPKGKGKAKVELKKIEDVETRQVTFSKRRQGLFNKAYELSILCGAMVGVVVFSISGRIYSIGHPSIDAVIDRFIPNRNVPATLGSANQADVGVSDTVHQLSAQYAQLKGLVDRAKQRNKVLKAAIDKEKGGRMMQWLTGNICNLGMGESHEYYKELQAIHHIVLGSVDDAMAGPSQIPISQPQAPAMDASSSQPHLSVDIASSSQQQYLFGEPSSHHHPLPMDIASLHQLMFDEPSSSQHPPSMGIASSFSQAQRYLFGESSSQPHLSMGIASSSPQQYLLGELNSQPYPPVGIAASSQQQYLFGEPSSQSYPPVGIVSSSQQYEFDNEDVMPTLSFNDVPASSTRGSTDGFEMDDLFAKDDEIHGSGDSGNFPNN